MVEIAPVYEPRKEKEITFIEKLSDGSAVWSRITGLEEFFRKCLVHASPSTEKEKGLGLSEVKSHTQSCA